jgi:hypothetical protein
MNPALILAGAGAVALATWGFGNHIFRFAGLPAGHQALRISAGAALLSTLIFALAAAQLLYLPAILLTLALGWIGLRRIGRPPVTLWAVPFAALGFYYFVHAWAPETSPDGSYYHLGFVRRYLAHGGFPAITTNFYASLSQGAEMLFLAAFAIGRHSAAALTHLGAFAVLAAAIAAYGHLIESPVAGYTAALLVFASPIAALDATLAYNDIAATAAVFATFLALEHWHRSRQAAWLWLIGLLAGFCFAIKYTAGVMIPVALVWVAVQSRSWRQTSRVAALTLICAAPWLAKNALVVHNPLSPFFNRVFPNPYVHVSFEDEYRHSMAHFNQSSLTWRTPWDVTVDGGQLQGTLGPVFLLAPLALLGVRRPASQRLLLVGTLAALPWFANLGTRFLLPALPFFALALMLTLARWRWLAIAVAAAQVALSLPPVLAQYSSPYNFRLNGFPWREALRLIPEEQTLHTRLPFYGVLRMVDAHTPPSALIYTALPLPEAYSDRRILLNYTCAACQVMQDLRWTPLRTDLQPITRVAFPNVPPGRTRIVQNGGCHGTWSISEIHGHQPSAPVDAWPDPWYAPRAVDQQPVTRWKAWRPVAPGMWFELQAAGGGLILDGPPDDANVCVHLERHENGAWHEMPQKPQISALPAPPGLRAQATAALRRLGVTHVLIHRDEPQAQDFETNAAAWRWRKQAESGPGRLYVLD